MKKKIIMFLIELLGGVPITIHYFGDTKGARGVGMVGFPNYKPYHETLVVDWTRQEVERFGNKRYETFIQSKEL